MKTKVRGALNIQPRWVPADKLPAYLLLLDEWVRCVQLHVPGAFDQRSRFLSPTFLAFETIRGMDDARLNLARLRTSLMASSLVPMRGVSRSKLDDLLCGTCGRFSCTCEVPAAPLQSSLEL